MNNVENGIPGKSPVLLAGDFNIYRFRNAGEEKPLYEQITNKDFIDAYAEISGQDLDSLCVDELNPDKHCTVGVTAFDQGIWWQRETN